MPVALAAGAAVAAALLAFDARAPKRVAVATAPATAPVADSAPVGGWTGSWYARRCRTAAGSATSFVAPRAAAARGWQVLSLGTIGIRVLVTPRASTPAPALSALGTFAPRPAVAPRPHGLPAA